MRANGYQYRCVAFLKEVYYQCNFQLLKKKLMVKQKFYVQKDVAVGKESFSGRKGTDGLFHGDD